MSLDKEFWNDRYKENNTGWDIGYVSPPLKNYIDQLTDKDIKILIPGAGNSYEAEYLHKQGFTNVYVADLSKIPLKNIRKRVSDFPKKNLIHGNYFEIQQKFDLIIEQTFFCAIDPFLRKEYVQKANELLNEKGKIAGLLFSVPLNIDKPPYGGNSEEYKNLFSPYFNIEIMDTAINSIPSRAGNELFIKLLKK